MKGPHGWVVRDATGWFVCEVTSEANAHRIAAAPDMEEALESMLSEHCGQNNHECDDIVHDLARTALAKAREIIELEALPKGPQS